jgi:hypothetical protein
LTNVQSNESQSKGGYSPNTIEELALKNHNVCNEFSECARKQTKQRKLTRAIRPSPQSVNERNIIMSGSNNSFF